MTPLQFTRWEDFAIRMAKTCFAKSRRPSSVWVLRMVEDFFIDISVDATGIACIRDWDNSDPHPTIMSMPIVGDIVSENLSEKCPNVRCKACVESYARTYGSESCRCDDIEYLAREQWDEQWGRPVGCCIRAGLDMASAPSAGVIGFTAGDIRRMYPEGVPEWVFAPAERLSFWGSGELNGTFEDLPDTAGLVL